MGKEMTNMEMKLTARGFPRSRRGLPPYSKKPFGETIVPDTTGTDPSPALVGGGYAGADPSAVTAAEPSTVTSTRSKCGLAVRLSLRV